MKRELAPFFARQLTLVPRSLLIDRTETLATQANTCGVLVLLSNFKFDAVVFTTTKVPRTCWSGFTKARLGDS